MRKWVRIHRRDQIFPSILDSASKEVVQVDTGGRLFRQVKGQGRGHVVEKSTCIRSSIGYIDILVRNLGHFGVPVNAMR